MELLFAPTTEDLRIANGLVQRVKPLLADIRPEIQGAALAQLLAIFLAGHIVEDSPEETDELRAALLQFHIAFVEQLIPTIAEELHMRSN